MKNILYFLILFYSFSLVADQELAYKATDPLASLNQLQTEERYTPNNFGAFGSSNQFLIKPIHVFEKSCYLPFDQIVRAKIPIETKPKTSSSASTGGLSDIQLFDLVVLLDKKWGRLGVGPIFIFPTASRLSTGQGKWQAGPALGFSYLAVPKWQFAFLAQNPLSFAGRKGSASVNQLFFQPIITHHFEKGWYIKSDGEWTVNWRAESITLPVNLGLGRVFKFFGHDINMRLGFEWMALRRHVSSTEHYTVLFELNFL